MIGQDISRTSQLINGNKFTKFIGCYRTPGVHAVIIYRYGQWLKKKNIIIRLFLEPIYLILYHRIRSKWGIEIPRSASIGEGLYIGHYGGIIISSAAVIGKNANISHQVTIGVAGQGEKRGIPVIGNNVYIAPGAKIFGKIKIGNDVTIGANAVIHKDLPDHATAVAYPGFKII